MKQIVDLQSDNAFQALDVALVSITFDSQQELARAAKEYGITTPLLTDTNKQVSKDYDVLQWATHSGEPSHTFVLVNTQGIAAWIRDYGSPQKPDSVMYVPVDELTKYIKARLALSGR
ncbi:redoxin domain-containing protein [candidate division KSB3 bacterium]|uniref:Redoxin domain-containing protein n=1 Tax=candidate division KSB3 bacterium TaxID=2044937 RepID=A0A9D5JRS0_9BACT|nr:redoxin domain-containing protein [candidate division KSB3 bacterium]MBD3323060.1 redoxin domain-containing protein [candidate division KSB3 bacterium]